MSMGISAAAAPKAFSGVPQEVVAAISAAVYAVYPGSRVKNIRHCGRSRRQSAWRMAGLLESTSPF